MLSALAHRMLRDHVHLWITFVFVSNTCVSLGITKTSSEDHATLLAFHRFTLCACGSRFVFLSIAPWQVCRHFQASVNA
jgi:hypothetical protein